jgi:hypothetical protein
MFAKIIVWALADRLFDRHVKWFLCNNWSVQLTASDNPLNQDQSTYRL